MTTLPRRLHITKRSVEALPIPDEDVVVWDDTLAGFGVRCLPSGRRTFVLQRRTRAGRSTRVKIARVGELSCEQARDEARKLVAQIVTGGDPGADRRKARLAERERRLAPTITDLAEAWVADRRPHWRSATAAEIERQLRTTILSRIGRLKAETLTPKRVKDLHAEISATAPIMANRIKSTIISMVAWAAAQDDWKAEARSPRPRRRTQIGQRRGAPRALPRNGELQRLVEVLHSRDDLAAKFYLFLLLSGCRRGEAENMRWSDVDLAAGVWTKPSASTKQKRVHRLPLSPEAVELLRAGPGGRAVRAVHAARPVAVAAGVDRNTCGGQCQRPKSRTICDIGTPRYLRAWA